MDRQICTLSLSMIPGAFVYNGEYIKDMYYDLAKVCIPYVSELDIDDEISKNWHNNKYPTQFYKKKPGAMVYMIGAQKK